MARHTHDGRWIGLALGVGGAAPAPVRAGDRDRRGLALGCERARRAEMNLDDTPKGYDTFMHERDEVMKIILRS